MRCKLLVEGPLVRHRREPDHRDFVVDELRFQIFRGKDVAVADLDGACRYVG